jgi:hypothetical protein
VDVYDGAAPVLVIGSHHRTDESAQSARPPEGIASGGNAPIGDRIAKLLFIAMDSRAMKSLP